MGLRKKKKKSAFHQNFFEVVFPTDLISVWILWFSELWIIGLVIFSPLTGNVCPQRHYTGLKGRTLNRDKRQRFKFSKLQQLNQFSGICSFS